MLQGYLAHNTPPPRLDPTVALRLGTYGGPRGGGVSYERGTPVGGAHESCEIDAGHHPWEMAQVVGCSLSHFTLSAL